MFCRLRNVCFVIIVVVKGVIVSFGGVIPDNY